KGSPLNDKSRFARYCAERGIRCIPVLALVDGKSPAAGLPDQDLFVKPASGRGGTGAERWDNVAAGVFAGPDGERLTGDELTTRLTERSRHAPLVVQPRLRPHSGLADLTTGALPTARVGP